MKNQTFGIEIETTGIGRERTAKAIAAYFGTTAQYRGRHLDDWRVPMPDGRHWTVESDGSVSVSACSFITRWSTSAAGSASKSDGGLTGWNAAQLVSG